MRLILLAFLCLVTSFASFAQTFEGRILYTNSYKSKMPNVADQQWRDMMGVTQEYFIKGGSYKSVMNGKLVQWQLFNNQEGRLYTKMSNSEAALWNDATINSDEVLKAEVKRGVTEVLGYKCDELTLTCKSGVQKYYFSSKLGVDAKQYVNHKFGNWYEMLKNTNAIPLKMVIDSPQFALESVATEVKPLKLDAKVLELPAGTKTEKSPY